LVATTAGVLAAAGLVVALLASGDASQIADHAPLISVPAPPAPISAPQPPPTAVAPPAPVASLVPTRELPSPARRRARRFAALPQPAAPPAPDRRALTDEAQRAFLRGDPVTALELCRQALEIDQAALQPLLVCALASCRLQSAERARGFLTRVPAERRRLIEPNCRALGIAAPVPSSMPRAD
jgi:hypothetical protein